MKIQQVKFVIFFSKKYVTLHGKKRTSSWENIEKVKISNNQETEVILKIKAGKTKLTDTDAVQENI